MFVGAERHYSVKVRTCFKNKYFNKKWKGFLIGLSSVWFAKWNIMLVRAWCLVFHRPGYNPVPMWHCCEWCQPMDGNNKDKTQSHFYIPRGKEDDLSNTLRRHFSHLRMKLQLQPIIIDNKIWTVNHRSWLPVLM